ncbi:hypothetical protein FCL47_07690 [Desulfopila sp. IMCC35006]|uniref:hypothetical protein n=1 Tax=Desulfopila sp. IMCC35006 TaxID=2569542 RepID=UPI0010AB5FB1|nr:hypothetical protein [Desulfopila sp. IMCC35006]TKB27053.1 hypothetical protein FCL47_07690 [Desulfopila sp. IMCC35006]
MKILLLTIVSVLCSMSLGYADSAGNEKHTPAPAGLTATKAYFDVTVGERKLLLIRLQLIEKTYNQIAAAGATPVFIVGIRGKASNFFTKGTDYVVDMDLPEKKQIAAMVEKFAARQIVMEQCLIAAGFQHIDAGDFLPQVKLVANGYMSMIGYQSRGYAFVPMD